MRDFRLRAGLWWQLTRREVEARHKGSWLGASWMLLGPLMEFAVYFAVFGFLFGGRFREEETSGGPSYALGVLIGLAAFRLIADALAQSPGLVLSQPNYVKKVVFPLELLPLSLVGVLLQRFAALFLLFAAANLAFGPGFGWNALWSPLILIPLVLLACGAALGLSALGVYLRDIGNVTPVLTMILLYSSCIFYPPERIREEAEWAWSLLRLNPVLQAAEALRGTLVWNEAPSAGALAGLWLAGVGVCAAGIGVFAKLRRGFADVI